MWEEARVRHPNHVVSPSELVLGDDGSDGGDASLLQDAGVGPSIRPGYTKDSPRKQ